MSEELREAMEVVSVRILEDAAFLFADPVAVADPKPADWNPRGAEIRWNGPNEGVMRIWAPPPLLGLLSANMLGIDDDDEPAAESSGLDALKEVLNMVAGNTLTEAWGPGPVFQLTIPTEADPSILEGDLEDGFWISADGHPVLLWGTVR